MTQINTIPDSAFLLLVIAPDQIFRPTSRSSYHIWHSTLDFYFCLQPTRCILCTCHCSVFFAFSPDIATSFFGTCQCLRMAFFSYRHLFPVIYRSEPTTGFSPVISCDAWSVLGGLLYCCAAPTSVSLLEVHINLLNTLLASSLLGIVDLLLSQSVFSPGTVDFASSHFLFFYM